VSRAQDLHNLAAERIKTVFRGKREAKRLEHSFIIGIKQELNK
jgi:hypothetical protein